MLDSQIDPDETYDDPDCELSEEEIEENKRQYEINRQLSQYGL